MNTLRTIILILIILATLKSIWMAIWPRSTQRVVDWWTGLPPTGLRATGIGIIVIGLLLIALAVSAMQNVAIAAVTIIGTLYVICGMAYFWPPVVQKWGSVFGESGREWTIRAAAIAGFIFVTILLIVYIQSAP